MKSISNSSNLHSRNKKYLHPRKPYDETHYLNGTFVRYYGKKIIGFGSSHIHHSNNPEHIASIQASVDQVLEKLIPGAMVLLEGSGNIDTRETIPEEFLMQMEAHKNSSEMVYALLKVCELKKTGKDINAIYPEPQFSDQIDFLIDRKVPAELIFSFFVIRNISVVLHNLAKDSNVSLDNKLATIQTLDDFINTSLMPIQVGEGRLTPADSFQLSHLLSAIDRSRSASAFSHIVQENGHQKIDKELLLTALKIAKSYAPSVQLESIVKDGAKANEFTAPIHAYNLQEPELKQLQNELATRSMNIDPLPRHVQQTAVLLNDLEDQARPILDRMYSRLDHFDTAIGTFSKKYNSSTFNVISSMLNVCREEGIKDKIREFSDRQVMVMFGSGHIRSLHTHFLNNC